MATSTSKNRKTNATTKPPVAKLRLGLLSASIWERTTDSVTFYSVTFERRYRDAKGEWHSTQTYDKTNLLTLSKLADQADTEITRLMARSRDEKAA
ncbi:MAG: hypothetical protein LC114_09260 [Bryobacterales bacterium]|nr:hypothetical protein [Bryobacterales bacterium]